MFEILHQNIDFEIVCSIIVLQLKHKKLLLYKRHLSTNEDIKTFG